MDELELIKNYKSAFLSHNNTEREISSSTLTTLMIKNPNLFITLSCNCLNSPKTTKTLKKIITTGLTKSLKKNPKNKNFKSIYFFITKKSKEKINSTGFNLLINPDDSIKNLAADLISTIYILDLSNDRIFNKILFSLSENVSHDNKEIQKASIITLGYICENLFKENDLILNKDEIDLLLNGIFKGLENYNELSISSVLSLGYSIDFLKDKFKNKKCLDFIYDSLLKFIIEGKKNNNFELIETTIKCLEEIARVNYFSFDFYYNTFFEEILNCGKILDDKIILSVNEFFKTMLETEKIQKKGYFDFFWEDLANYCLEFLLDYKENEEEQDSGLSLTKSFFYLLNTINSIFITKTQKTLLKFVYDYIEDNNNRIKIVALLIFESLLEFSEKNIIFNELQNGFNGLIDFIKSENFFLQRQALIFITKVAEYHSYVLLDKNNFEKLLDIFLIILDSEINTEKGNKIKILVLQTFEKLTEKDENEKNKEILHKNITPIFNSIFKCFFQTENLHLISLSFSTTFSFIINIFCEENLNIYYKKFQEILLKTYQIEKKEIQSIFIESIQINLTAILNQIKNTNSVLEITNNTNLYLYEGYKYTQKLIKEKKDYYDEELYYMAMILTFNKNFFKDEINNFMYTYLVPSLTRVNEEKVFKNALDALENVISVFSERVESFVYDILPSLICILKNGECNRDLNEGILYIISQIIFNFPKISTMNLEDIFNIIKTGNEAIFFFLGSEKISEKNYGEKLLRNFLDLNICIIHGIYLDNIFENFDNLIENNICDFILFLEKILKYEKIIPDFEFVMNILGLMVDFVNKKREKKFIKIDFYKEIRAFFDGGNNSDEVFDFLDYADGVVKEL